MATVNYIRDLSEYLMDGTLSDLTLKFREKSWPIHKAIACCHSKWFQKAVTIGFEETNSGVIVLYDDPEFADAIDCMVSYFYKAGYNDSQYGTSEALLHAQVCIIADKYDCASLYKLAKTSLAKTVKDVDGDDWVGLATLIYDHTTMELLTHKDLRRLVVSAVANCPTTLTATLQSESAINLFRSNADLATDLLLSGLLTLEAEQLNQRIPPLKSASLKEGVAHSMERLLEEFMLEEILNNPRLELV